MGFNPMDALGSVLSFAGGLYAQDKTDSRQDEAQKFNAAEAQKSRDFTERMSSSAYQRGMADMKLAGLNPILAYQKGPASSPSGATASTSFTPATDIVSPAVNTAMASMRLRAEIDNMRATNANLIQDLNNKKAEEMLTKEKVLLTATDDAKRNAEMRILREKLSPAELEKVKADIDKELYKTGVGEMLRTSGTAGDEIGRAAGGVKSVVDIVKPGVPWRRGTPFNDRWRGNDFDH